MPHIYSDQEVNGYSQGSFKTHGNSIIFNYQLKEGFQFPYVGIYFDLLEDALIKIDTSFQIKLNISATKGKDIPVILNEQVILRNDTIDRVWQQNIKISSDQKTYNLQIQDFSVPAWWYKTHRCSETDFHPLNIYNIKGLCIQNCTLLQLGESDLFKISDLSIHKNWGVWKYTLGIFTIVWYLIGFILLIFSYSKRKSVYIPYIITDAKTQADDSWSKIQTYISQHYMKDLNLEMIQQDLGIAKHKITALIKENSNLIFKQYLNQIRIAEAKRLLSETDLPIGEISDLVGYGHISNFNRVFKEYTGQSPSELRKEK